MTVEEAIKKSGTTNIMGKGSTKKAQGMIGENEEVLYAINTNVSLIDNNKMKIDLLSSLKNSLNGVIVITNRRIIFCSSIIGNTNIKQILIQDITSIDESINGLTRMGKIRVQGVTQTFVINIFKAKIVDELRESIYKAQELQKQTNNTIINNNLSNADEIMKFKQLLDEGIISQEEFEKKKQELLK